jgi:hypothetical protein
MQYLLVIIFIILHDYPINNISITFSDESVKIFYLSDIYTHLNSPYGNCIAVAVLLWITISFLSSIPAALVGFRMIKKDLKSLFNRFSFQK